MNTRETSRIFVFIQMCPEFTEFVKGSIINLKDKVISVQDHNLLRDLTQIREFLS